MSIRSRLREAISTGIWRPESARLLLRDLQGRQPPPGPDEAHLRAAAAWLGRAQDAVEGGGVSGRYFLASGWSAAYPETTGYLVPTFLELSEALGEPAWRERGARAIAFLRGLQLPGGGFPGGEVDENLTAPSVFNTGQILNGLIGWHAATGDPDTLEAIGRAGRWLASVQEENGSFLGHTYLGVSATYHAHATCWLTDAALLLGDPEVEAAARRHVAWCLEQYDPAARWLDRCGFTAADHEARRSVTHTFAYAMFGVLHASERLGIEDGIAMVRDVAGRAAELTRERGRLPGVVDATWRGDAPFACLTGNVQMALVWHRLDEIAADPGLRTAAAIAVDVVKAAQPMRSRDPGIRGGVPGSTPVWGPYIQNALPNWAAKFLIDVLLVRSGREHPGRIR